MRGALIISAELIGRGDKLPSVWSGVRSEAFKYTPPYRPEFVILTIPNRDLGSLNDKNRRAIINII